MKKFYLISMVGSVAYLLLLLVADFAAPREYFTAKVLLGDASHWEIKVDSSLSSRLDNHDMKGDLVKFIDKNKNNYDPGNVTLIPLAIIFLYGLIGFIRERRLKKNKYITNAQTN